MKIFNIQIFNPEFKGQRQDRKTISQLKQENKYDLNVPNQRRISNAIDNLSKIPGEKNIDFLLDVADNLKYGTNIDLGKKPYNDWNSKLKNAAKNSYDISDETTKEKLKLKIEQSLNVQKPLTNKEKELLQARTELLSKIDFEALNSIPQSNIKNIKRNLDYFIISSEVSIAQKLYILKRLNYFMSPEYKINPQLQNKKSQALAEMVNDIVVNTPESKVPNIKAIDQKQHGICAAISICRKLLAYEDKPNYIDMIISELDDKDYIEVYDITKLGSHTKIPIQKCDIDFNYALAQGYRIVDTSAMYWMNVADTAGATNEVIGLYSPFDRQNFDTFNDMHINADLAPELVDQQDYYRALLVAKNNLTAYKKLMLEQKYLTTQRRTQANNNLETLQKYNASLKTILHKITPNSSNEEIRALSNDLLSLYTKNAQKAETIKDYKKDFLYLPNESKNAKLEKIKAFLNIAIQNDKNPKLIEENASEILELTELIHQNGIGKTKSISNLNKARKLYAAAAAYRTQTVFQLDIPEKLQELEASFDMSDDETLIIENLDTLIKKLQKNKINPELRQQLAINFESENTNEALLTSLNENKETVKYILTDIMDNLYQCCLSVNRKTALANELKSLTTELETDNNPISIIKLADKLHVKENKKSILEKLNYYISILDSENCTEEQYLSIYKQMGHTSQLKDFKETFERLGIFLFEEPNENIIRGFNALNGGNPDVPIDETLKYYNQIAQNFNNISGLINGYQKALRITDSNNNILNTTIPKEIILKKLENMGEIISNNDLQILNNKFTKIAKAKSQKDNGSFKDKDLPAELTALTPQEKDILKKIEQNINAWYSIVSRKLNYEYKDLKSELNEHHRQIGVKTGRQYVHADGSSGLNSRQEVKIIEHMTDRPYYIEYDGKLAVKNIKKSPYSGISSTSVMDNDFAPHAQYVVDVKPVKIKVNAKEEIKDLIVHDNTWGAVEHDNTWIDENGLLRTDYEAGYGGQQGYITDENYRNGKIAENIFEQTGIFKSGKNINSKLYKKLDKYNEEEGYKFPLFTDFIAPGRYPNSMTYIQMIRENTLLSPAIYLDDLEKYANKMSKKQIEAAIQRAETAGSQTRQIYQKYIKRINGDKILNNGISTQADYDKLPENDELKIALEKLAIIKSYSSIPDLKLFYKANSIKDLQLMKQTVEQEARRNFDYAFAKNIDIIKYGTESVRYEIYKILDDFANKNHIKLTQTDKLRIVNSMKQISPKDFDGNLEHTINTMISNLIVSMNKKTPSFENKKEKIEALANTVETILQTKMGFTLADLNSSSFSTGRLESIAQWIDKTFNPATDEEFVQIFNKLRNMSKDEFDKQFNSKISDTDLGIKNITGYELLKQLRSENEKTTKSFINMIYSQESSKDIELSKTTPSYNYNKFERVYHGGKYVKNKRSFDDIYLDYYYSLLTLGLGKYYERYSQQIFDNYNLYFAYPKVNPESEEQLQESIENLYKNINDDMEAIAAFKAQIKSFDIIKNLQKITQKLDEQKPLTKKQHSIITKELREFCQINDGDETIANILNKINYTIENGKTAGDFKNLVEMMWKELSPYQKTTHGLTMEEAIKASRESIQMTKNDFVKNIIEPKYQQKALKILNKWIAAKSKTIEYSQKSDKSIKQSEEAEQIYLEFLKLFEKHRIFQSPEKVLNEFLLMSAKDARPQNLHDSGDKAVKAMKDFESLKTSYKNSLTGLLFNANLLEIQYILMDCAKNGSLNIVRDSLKNSKLQLKNGTEVPMDSDIALNFMLAPMLADVDLDTAIMFVEQLGLTEKVVEMATKDSSFKSAYKSIKRIHSILDSISKQSKIIGQELKNLENIDNDPNYKERILASKENIIKKTRNTNYRLTSEIYQKAIENAITQIENNPDRSKFAILSTNMDAAISASKYVAQQNIAKYNDNLMKIQVIHDLVTRIKLPENSPAEAMREKYIEEFKKIEEYKSTFKTKYKEINVTTA